VVIHWDARSRPGRTRMGRSPSGGPLRSLGRGSSPSWSPDGSHVALRRDGWVWAVRVCDGTSRRVARGTAPAWSPDGQLIAYTSVHEAVYTVGADGGHPRQVG
jgi:Tol biopolymer transport system component